MKNAPNETICFSVALNVLLDMVNRTDPFTPTPVSTQNLNACRWMKVVGGLRRGWARPITAEVGKGMIVVEI
jgi:hypothetical protein